MYKEIENRIFKGLKSTCSDAILFNHEFEDDIRPEYLITVNIAKAIGELNSAPGSPLIVRLEESTKEFTTRCVPDMSWEGSQDSIKIFAPTIFRNRHNTERNGRFDICVYEGQYEKPVTAIELKLIDPTEQAIKDDIARLSEILHLNDNTGTSKVKYTYFACVEINKDIKFKNQRQGNLAAVKEKYHKWLENLTDDKTGFDVCALNIDDLKTLTANKMTGDPIFDSDLVAYAKHYVGVIVRLMKKV